MTTHTNCDKIKFSPTRFFIYFLLSGLFVKALVHPVAGHVGAFRRSLQLLLDNPGIAALASQ